MIKRGIVTSYGRRWNKKACQKNSFADIPKIRGKRIGLYVLYKDTKIVYLGKSETNLRRRIKEHTQDRLKQKWNFFSWFITRPKYTADLEALIHRLFWDTSEIGESIARGGFIEARRYPAPR